MMAFHDPSFRVLVRSPLPLRGLGLRTCAWDYRCNRPGITEKLIIVACHLQPKAEVYPRSDHPHPRAQAANRKGRFLPYWSLSLIGKQGYGAGEPVPKPRGTDAVEYPRSSSVGDHQLRSLFLMGLWDRKLPQRA